MLLLLTKRAKTWRGRILNSLAAGGIIATSLTGSPVSAATVLPYQSSVLSDAPVAYWRLGEASGTTAADASGKGHPGTLNGAVKLGTTGALLNDADTAMTFDGSTTSVRSSTTVAVGADFSIEAWTKANATSSYGTIASVYANGQVRTLYLNGRQFVGLTDIGANWPAYAVSSSALDPSVWHHVVFTIQGGSNLKLYVDGALAGSTTAPVAASFSGNPVIGWSDATWVSHFNGAIDEVALYPTALPATNVKGHFTTGRTATTTQSYQSTTAADGPVAYWRLGEASGTIAADASGKNHPGTLNGAVKLGTAGALLNDADTAMTFDGSTTSVRSNTTVAVGADFSIEAWAKANATSSYGTIASVYANGQVRTLYLNGRQFVGLTDIGANWPAYAVSSPDLDPSVWHHVVFTIQGGSNLKLYVDGALAGSTTAPVAASFSGNPVIGWSDATWVSHFNGAIDEVALYPSALPGSNISAHYAASGRLGSTVPGPTPTPAPVPPTPTAVPPTPTAVPPTPTAVPPTPTAVPPTPTAVPSPPTCSASLQQLVDAAASGAVVSAPACMYRETVTINKPLTLAGQPGAEIRGSDVWTAWSQTGSTWTSQQTVPPLARGTNADLRCGEPTLRCLLPEQVFVDGKALYPLATGATPAAGQYALDGARHVVLAANPNGHLLEVSTRSRWIVTGADNVTIQGFTMRHAGNDAQTGAVSNDSHSNWTLQDTILSDAHGGNVSVSGATNLKVLRNDISRGGNLGLAGWSFNQSLIQGNHLHDNGTDLFNHNWSMGGLKMSQVQSVIVDGNESDHNGDGIWCDEGCQNVTFSANRVHDNFQLGILFEISNGASIHDNVLWNNGWGPVGWVWGGGIVVSSSANTEIYNNTLAWNRAGISVVDQTRPKPAAPWGHYVHDNTMIRTQQTGVDFWANVTLAWTSDNGNGPGSMFDPASNNHGANNAYWEDKPEDVYNIARYAWYGGMGALSNFVQTPGDVGGHYITTAAKDQALAAKGMPMTPPAPITN